MADDPALEEFELAEPEEFFFTKQGGDSKVTDVNDATEFTATQEAMTLLGISADFQNQVFGVLSGLLHLGNVEVMKKNRRTDDSKIADDDSHIDVAARLLGLDEKALRKWLTNRSIITRGESFVKPLLVEDAVFTCHALAKHVYAFIFDWLVERTNESLAGTEGSSSKDSFIGILDIYGFETFKVNSFEQFCINYANEKLQQLFNQHIFKLEQEEYVREEITWSFIDFYDNQPCIDLIEDRGGILSLLDEQCRVPKGNDNSWALNMYQNFGDRPHFDKPRMSDTAFIVNHYAGSVQYEVGGFLNKNKDTLNEEHLVMLRESASEIVALIFSEKRAGGGGNKKSRATVGTQFQASLDALMETLSVTEPHYIRCLKPNDAKVQFEYDRERCMEQLLACGVLETIRISAAGYPSRWTYPEFLERYTYLVPPETLDLSDQVSTCESILRPLIADTDKFQFGKTKIFFRAGQVRLRIIMCCTSLLLFLRACVCGYVCVPVCLCGVVPCQYVQCVTLGVRMQDHKPQRVSPTTKLQPNTASCPAFDAGCVSRKTPGGQKKCGCYNDSEACQGMDCIRFVQHAPLCCHHHTGL